MLSQTLRSRWFATLVHVGLWLLLYLAVVNMGGKTPNLHEHTGVSPAPESPAPVDKLSSLFAPGILHTSFAGTNGLDPFYTKHFVPPPAPAPAPPPTTRKIPLVYLGFYSTAGGPRQAMFKEENIFRTLPVGTPVATNTFIADAGVLTLTLTNSTGQTNIFQLNKPGQIEVPIK